MWSLNYDCGIHEFNSIFRQLIISSLLKQVGLLSKKTDYTDDDSWNCIETRNYPLIHKPLFHLRYSPNEVLFN